LLRHSLDGSTDYRFLVGRSPVTVEIF